MFKSLLNHRGRETTSQTSFGFQADPLQKISFIEESALHLRLLLVHKSHSEKMLHVLRRQTLDMKSSKPFSERVDALRELLDVTHPDLDGMCGMSASKVRARGLTWLGEAG